MYTLLQTEMPTQDKITLEAGRPMSYHILAGDLNAALHTDDKQTGVHLEDTMLQCAGD